MVNHPNRTRAADRRAVERLVKAAEAWASVAGDAGRMAGKRGILSDAMATRQEKAEAAFREARDALRARFAEAE